jgi:hypothetical protein
MAAVEDEDDVGDGRPVDEVEEDREVDAAWTGDLALEAGGIWLSKPEVMRYVRPWRGTAWPEK